MTFNLSEYVSRVLGNRGVPGGIAGNFGPGMIEGMGLDVPSPAPTLPKIPPSSRIVDGILNREKGYTLDPDDPGGPTNFGITQETLANSRGDPRVSAQDVQNMKVEEARKIYEDQYIAAPGFNTLPPGLMENVIDSGVMSGPVDATKQLQRVLKKNKFDPGEIDGRLGPKTKAALNSLLQLKDVKDVSREYTEERRRHLKKVAKNTPTQKKWLNGWMNRLKEFE